MKYNNDYSETPAISPEKFKFRVTNRDGEKISLHAIDIRTGEEWELVHVPQTVLSYRWKRV